MRIYWLLKYINFLLSSKVNDPEEYFKKKRQLTLLEFVFPSGIPCLDFENVFGKDYYFASQKEILLPSFLNISFYEMELAEREKNYRDIDGLPPCGKYLVIVEGICLKAQCEENEDIHLKNAKVNHGKRNYGYCS